MNDDSNSDANGVASKGWNKQLLNWIKQRRIRQRAVDQIAIAMMADAKDPIEAYFQARGLSHAASDQGKHEQAVIYARASSKIARVAGYRSGPKEYGESRMVQPTMKVEGERIVRTIQWWNFWD